jgi:DNA-binding NtrC family response regulator
MPAGAGHILLVNGNPNLDTMARAAARAAHCQLTVVADFRSARKLLATRQFDLILIDPAASNGEGLAAVQDMDLTGQGRVVVAGNAPGHNGHAADLEGFEFLSGPLWAESLARLMKEAALRTPSREIPPDGQFGGMIGRTMRMQALFANIRRVAPLEVGVLVHGESGTGKELVARALHRISARTGKFVAVNCGALTPELLSSQLFGHERGSFTGATQLHTGYFEQARGGTLFLDEISEMPQTLQVYLLRVIETHSLTRVGGSREIPLDVRVIAASNRDLSHAVASGTLRSDLYFRLLEFPLAVPPLRERREDIPLLAQHFLDQLNEKHGTSKRFAASSLGRLIERPWPGNVRELLHMVRRQYILTGDAGEIRIQEEAGQMLLRRASDRHSARPVDAAADAAGRFSAGDGAIHFSIGTTFEEIEREVLLKTLAHFGNNKREAARVLGISLKTVYNKLLRYRSQGLIGPDVLDGSPEDKGHAA